MAHLLDIVSLLTSLENFINSETHVKCLTILRFFVSEVSVRHFQLMKKCRKFL